MSQRAAMYRIILLIVTGVGALLVPGASCGEPPSTAPTQAHPAAANAKTYNIATFLNSTQFSGGSFSPKADKILISGDQSGIYNVYAIDVDTREHRQLTHSTRESLLNPRYFPDGKRLLYEADQGGNELTHVFMREPDGKVVDLTPGDGLKAAFRGWAHDDQSFYIESNERDVKHFDIYQYAVSDFSRKLLFENKQALTLGAISRDGRYLALSKVEHRNNSDIYLFDSRDSTLHLISEHQGNINHLPLAFSPDGQWLYLSTDRDSQFRYLIRYRLRDASIELVIREPWDIESANFSHKGNYLALIINNDARGELRLFHYPDMKDAAVGLAPHNSATSFEISRDETKLFYLASSSNTPGDVYYQHLGSHPVAATKLTHALSPDISADDLVHGRIVRFASFDGVSIPGILYKPHQASSTNKLPALIWVHGGPGGQSRIGYEPLIQYLLNHGYVVYAINNRGSSGYGKNFHALDDGRHGRDDLDDCVAAKTMLINTGFVDAERVGIIGRSYGGYMALAAQSFRAGVFKVGVDMYGISNWQRTLNSIPAWWEYYRKALHIEFGDFANTSYLNGISPLFHADKIRSPLMVVQGANDPRVLKIEADEIVAAARKNGVPVEYLLFEDEGHGLKKRVNRQRAYGAIRAFLDRYLKG